MPNLRNSENLDTQRADFFGRNEPNMAWVHSISSHLLIPGLRAFWPTSANHDDHVNIFCDDVACGYDLTLNANPVFQLWNLGLPPCLQFAKASSQYLQHADNAQFDILGTETTIKSGQRGLTTGGWFRWTDKTGQQALISKWTTVGNQRSYRVYKNATNNIVFEVSNLGSAVDGTITSSVTVNTNIWYHIVARYTPSTAMDIYIDAVRATSVAAIPASIFHSNAVFNIGRSNATDYFDGYASLFWLAASNCWDGVTGTRDLIPWALYDYSRVMYNKL